MSNPWVAPLLQQVTTSPVLSPLGNPCWNRDLSWEGTRKQGASVEGDRSLSFLRAGSLGDSEWYSDPFCPLSPWSSSTQPPLDEGHAVISLAPQRGAAKVVQVLSQLDERLLHSAPGGWGGKAGIQRGDSGTWGNQASQLQGLQQPRQAEEARLQAQLRGLCTPSGSHPKPSLAQAPGQTQAQMKVWGCARLSEHRAHHAPRNSSCSLHINSAPLPRAAQRGGGREWHRAREETVTATGLEDG